MNIWGHTIDQETQSLKALFNEVVLHFRQYFYFHCKIQGIHGIHNMYVARTANSSMFSFIKR